jgi:hypothetical protein
VATTWSWLAAITAVAMVAVVGCSSRREIHCVGFEALVEADSPPGLNPLALGMSLCFESRDACEQFRHGPDTPGPLAPTAETCIAVPKPVWHCTGMSGDRSPQPFDTCLPSLRMCEDVVAARRNVEYDDSVHRHDAGPLVRPQPTPCRPVPTVACTVSGNQLLQCQSSLALCEDSERMVQQVLRPPPPPSRCELR